MAEAKRGLSAENDGSEALEATKTPRCYWGRPIPHQDHGFAACSGWEAWDGVLQPGMRVHTRYHEPMLAGTVTWAEGTKVDVQWDGYDFALRTAPSQLTDVEGQPIRAA